MELEKELEVSEINWGLPLPLHFAPIIFSKVPIPKLPALRLVSKSWNRLVVDYAPTSTRKAVLFSTKDYYRHFDRRFLNPKIHCFDVDTLSFVASCAIIGPLTKFITIYSCCNGLLFLENGGFEIGCQSEGILYPLTHEFFPIPLHEEFLDGFFQASDDGKIFYIQFLYETFTHFIPKMNEYNVLHEFNSQSIGLTSKFPKTLQN